MSSDQSPQVKQSFRSKLKERLSGSSQEKQELEKQPSKDRNDELLKFNKKVDEASAVALQTGKPQFIGLDSAGKRVFVEPPKDSQGRSVSENTAETDPETQKLYSDPNVRFIKSSIPEKESANPFDKFPFKAKEQRMGPGYKGPGYGPGGAVMGSLIAGGPIGGL